MAIALGCIADDYTGASDLANTLASNGLRTVQTIGLPAVDLDLDGIDALVVAFKIRSVAPAEAIAAATRADSYLRAAGACHVLFKICSTFDSTDAGNIGPVLEALADLADASVVPVTPAFPETGRRVFMGHLFVGETPLHESPLKDHPLNPMHDANLVRVLGRQMRGQVGLVPLPVVSAGPRAVAERLDRLSQDGYRAAIVDAVALQDLLTIGVAAARLPLSVGASGLGMGLARALAQPDRASNARPLAPVGGASAIMAGSCSQATLQQIAVAERVLPVLRLDQDRLVRGAGEVERALDFARRHLADRTVLISASGTPEEVAQIQGRYGREAAGYAIEAGLARIAEELIALGVRRLIVAGGETSGAIVDRLAIPAFEIGPEIAPGVPVLRSLGRNGPALQMALKSGNFGAAEFFLRALEAMA